MSPTARSAKPKPVPPWKRTEAGVYQSSDDRFSIQSEGPSRWFITDEKQQDELGLARTVGPFDTLDAAKAAAEALRDEAPATSPLAGRLAKDGATPDEAEVVRRRSRSRPKPKPPPPPPRTWLDKLEDDDREAARHARRLIAALEDEGIEDADALVRRDITGNEPVIAARLLAREILAAVGTATKPQSVVEAVVQASAPRRSAVGSRAGNSLSAMAPRTPRG